MHQHRMACSAGVALTMLRHLPSLAKAGLVARDLTAPFGRIVDQEVTHPWLRNLMDLECFVLRRVLSMVLSCLLTQSAVVAAMNM